MIGFAIGVYLAVWAIAAYHTVRRMNEELPARDIGDYAAFGYVFLCVTVAWGALALLAGLGKLVAR